ncbi:MAG TPA: PC4/YdbC family ssDNA-binding protein [Sandaracinaceae bacterium LLY-WYZ-13_1]|nr:PC4/YdbC family ssDNA-binding protein [Sandaracinaceae bacterium LLY-WYZ-13_1]
MSHRDATAAQVSLFPTAAAGGRFDTASEEESAAYGRALLAEMRGEELTEAQRAMLARARANAAADRRAPTPVVDVSETLLRLDRGERSEVRVSWRRYKGSSPFLDFRRWERLPGDDEMRPTRQGVTIRAREITRLLTTVVQAARRLSTEAD